MITSNSNIIIISKHYQIFAVRTLNIVASTLFVAVINPPNNSMI